MARLATIPNGENCSAAELKTAAQAAPTRRSNVRLTAIRALLLDVEHAQVATIFGVTRRTLSTWVRRFNDKGIDGLIERPRAGRPRKIGAAQSVRYRQLIDEPKLAGESHWTARKFHGYLRQNLQLEVGYSTVVRWLHENDFRLKVPQPWPDRQDEEARQRYRERLRALLTDDQVDLWYVDETGVEGDPRPRRRWAKKGEKSRVGYRGEHVRMNVTGMICPRTGEFYALEFTHSDSVVFQTFLDHANADLKPTRRRNVLICDNASWHKKKTLAWGAFEPMFLPPYSPDLNPIERLWLLIKAEWFTDFIAKNRDTLCERLDKALLWAMGRQEHNRKTCAV